MHVSCSIATAEALGKELTTMTNVYFVRHAESDHHVHDDMTRPLTEKGLCDRALVSNYFNDIAVAAIFSSPFKRAYDTVAELALQKGLNIGCMDAFRERAIADVWIEDFTSFSKQQWEDFDYKISSGESLRETQTRNIQALQTLLSAYPNETIVIGSHGTALSTVINYYDNTFTYEQFNQIVGLMPWIVHFTFNGDACASIDSINLFEV